jgi:hypothetical protein
MPNCQSVGETKGRIPALPSRPSASGVVLRMLEVEAIQTVPNLPVSLTTSPKTDSPRATLALDPYRRGFRLAHVKASQKAISYQFLCG